MCPPPPLQLLLTSPVTDCSITRIQEESATPRQSLCTERSLSVRHTTTWDDVRETLEAVERFGLEALSKRDAPS